MHKQNYNVDFISQIVPNFHQTWSNIQKLYQNLKHFYYVLIWRSGSKNTTSSMILTL